jgi:hypothetical protein
MKPPCKLPGTRDVVEFLILVNRTLRDADLNKEAEEFLTRATDHSVYEEMVRLAREYVEIE